MRKHILTHKEIKVLKHLNKIGEVDKNYIIKTLLSEGKSKEGEQSYLLCSLVNEGLIIENDNNYILAREGIEYLTNRKKWLCTTIIAILAAVGTVGSFIVSIINLLAC